MKKSRKWMSLVTCGALITTILAGCGSSSSGGSANTTAAGSSETTAAAATTAAPAADATTAAEASGGSGDFSGVKLVYWSNWESTEPQGIVITEAVKEFEAETGAQVDLQFKGRKGIKEGLIPALDADQQVDLFDGAGNKSNYGDRIICLEDLMKANDYEKDTNPALMTLNRSYYSDGQLYEIPYQMKANGYLYNKDMFDKAGIWTASGPSHRRRGSKESGK